MATRSLQLLLIFGCLESLALAGQAAQRQASDVNGDGRDDLVIGVPYEDVVTFQDGAAHLLFGGPAGLTAAGAGFGHQNSPGVPDACEADDSFSLAMAAGDFDGDGFPDLAVGVPYEDVGSAVFAGAVHVFYGSPAGYTLAGNQFWTQDSPGVPGVADGDQFGAGLAAGDFNGDGRADLVIGAPNDTVSDQVSAGSLVVLYGGPNGVQTAGAALFDVEQLTGVAGTYWRMGTVLETGDFDRDGHADLAVGVPSADVGGAFTAGQVVVLMGSASGLSAASPQRWNQDSPGMADAAESSDFFGGALAVGDFDGDGHADLAVGAPWEDFDFALQYVGAVNVLYGGPGGLSASAQFWHQDAGTVLESAEVGDQFGERLGSGDFNGDGRDDLAVGVPEERLGGLEAVGVVHVLYGASGGLADAGNQLWSQDSPGVEEQAEARDRFGRALLAGDFNGDGRGDLAIGVPQENFAGVMDAGVVQVLYGGVSGLAALGDQLWSQDSPGIVHAPGVLDGFGLSLQ